MGVVRTLLGRAEMRDAESGDVLLELNESGEVHVQTRAWRLELSPEEFLELADEMGRAAAALRRQKDL